MVASLANLKRNKVAGPDRTVMVILAASDDFGIEKIREIINK